MFFRLKATQSGQVLKLVESYRDDTATSRHRAVASLGNAAIEPDDRKPIAKAVEDRLYGRDHLLARELSEKQRAWVDRIVRQVASEGRWSPLMGNGNAGAVIDGVRADEVTHTETAELGPVLVGWQTWKRLGMGELLQVLGLNRSQSQAAAISVINRLVDPSSEHSLLDWYRCCGLPELMGNKLRGAGDDRFYRVSDQLLAHQAAIEKHLRERQESLFNLSRTVLLYDLTNTHFEGLCAQNPKAQRGANKQKRNDCPQIVVGMVFDQFGFEMAHKIFAGAQHDSKSLLTMIEDLNAAAGDVPHKPLVVMDAGVATSKNRTLLREHGFGYLVNDTRGHRGQYREQFQRTEGFCKVKGREGKDPVMVLVMEDPHAAAPHAAAPQGEAPQGETPRGEAPERIVLCKSDRRADKELAIISNAEKRFVEALGKLAARVEQSRLKDRDKIQQALGRIQAKHTRVRRYYQVKLEELSGKLRLTWLRDDIQFAQAADLCGCYVLRTDERTLNEHELWQLYICLTHAEDGFKALKTDLGLRPNRHHKEERVDAHVFICVLAYHLLRTILWTLEQKGDHRTWETLKRVLQTHCYTTIVLPTESGQTHRIRKAGQPEECQKAIYRQLGIEWTGLPTMRSVIGSLPAQTENRAEAATL